MIFTQKISLTLVWIWIWDLGFQFCGLEMTIFANFSKNFLSWTGGGYGKVLPGEFTN
jgi:hypothetical protein